MESAILERIREAAVAGRPLAVRGGGSKSFYLPESPGEPLNVRAHSGIVEYEPSELVLVARAGTPLTEVEAALATEGQMLAFEPPDYTGSATLGGAVASGFAGPRRAYSGAVRDFVLGVRIADGRGQDLRFGGRVIKNVAGYDVSRVMAGAFGTLGVLLEVALKVQPRPAAELSLAFEMPQSLALSTVNTWSGRPLPLSASSYSDGVLCVRLSGAEAGVRAARHVLGGEALIDGDAHWRSLRDQTHVFFTRSGPLWRASLPATAEPLALSEPELIEWGGALRWLSGEPDEAELKAAVAAAGGHVRRFRGPGGRQPSPPVPVAQTRIQAGLKLTFDPGAILNRGLEELL
jgi:glycolate oxidase FAD binding subunit